MNSTYAKLLACLDALKYLADNKPETFIGERVNPDWRAWMNTVAEVNMVMQRVFLSVEGPSLGPCPARDVSRWSMSRAEWAGQE